MAKPPVQAALKQVMNSGHRPPNLVVTEDQHRTCQTCNNWNGVNRCRLYDYATAPNEVCDSWEPKPN